MKAQSHVAILLAGFLSTCPLMLVAQNAIFTYQGHVIDNGTNFTGIGQFKFALVTSTNFNHQATAVAQPPSGGFVTVINVVDGGNGYAIAPGVTVTGGGGTGVVAHSTITSGAVTSITVDNPGHGYTNTPTVIVDPPPANISYTTYWSNDGTGSAGSEPSSAISIGVSSGLFTVALGDVTIPNMSAISPSIFSQAANLQLRIWFNDGNNGSSALNPVQNLTPAPYAIQAGNAAALTTVHIVQNTNGAPDLVGGSTFNYVAIGVIGGTIAGGGATNSAYFFPTTSGSNSVTADFGTVGGGGGNVASGPFATVGGGNDNTASGSGATVPGGGANVASGVNSFAAGVNARATNAGSFVWADSSLVSGNAIPPFTSTNNNQFSARATGGVRFVTAIDPSFGNPTAGVVVLPGSTSWSTISDRDAKKNFQPIDGNLVLEKLDRVSVQQWNYKWEKDGATPNIGPVAQDFKAAFYPGRDNKSISTLEFDGVELAAIKGLNQKLNEKTASIERQAGEIAALKARLETLEALVYHRTHDPKTSEK